MGVNIQMVREDWRNFEDSAFNVEGGFENHSNVYMLL